MELKQNKTKQNTNKHFSPVVSDINLNIVKCCPSNIPIEADHLFTGHNWQN